MLSKCVESFIVLCIRQHERGGLCSWYLTTVVLLCLGERICQSAVSLGGVPHLIAMLKDPNPEVVEKATGTIANLAIHSTLLLRGRNSLLAVELYITVTALCC